MDRRRFAFERANEPWHVMHGPAVFGEGRRKRKSYLIGLLDDATRVVPYAAFAFAENTAAFLPVFKQALLRRGHPQATLRRQRRPLPLDPARSGLRQARHHPDPRASLPAPGKG